MSGCVHPPDMALCLTCGERGQVDPATRWHRVELTINELHDEVDDPRDCRDCRAVNPFLQRVVT